MAFPRPKPKLITEQEVVLARDDWDQIVTALEEAAEDAADLAAVLVSREEDARFAAHLEAERGEPVEITIPIEVIEAKFDGVHPLAAWRGHRGWTPLDLEAKAGVAADLIAGIEARREYGDIGTMTSLARALRIPVEAVLEAEDTLTPGGRS